MVDWTLEAIEAAHCAMFQEPYDGTTAVMIGAGLDAAAAAQGMDTENSLREENARLAALASQASLEASQLREALKPFANRLDELEKSPLTKYACATSVEIDHLRAARAAIREGGKDEN